MKPRTQAITLDRHGDASVLQLTSFTLPDLGATGILLRQEAIGVNFKDIYQRSGLYPLSLPSGLGFEAAGVIESVGSAVTDLHVGDRVGYCYGSLGAYASHCVIDASLLVPLPSYISCEDSAAVLTKGLTARYLLRETYSAAEGDWIVIHAAAGGVGSLMVEWALHFKAQVIATVGVAEKVSFVRKLGAEHVLTHNDPDFIARVMEITSGAGVKVVYDSIGATTWENSLKIAAPRGLVVTYGNASGPVPAFSPQVLAKRSLYVTRPSLGAYLSTRNELLAAAQDLFTAIKDEILHVRIAKRFSLKDAGNAHRFLESRKALGSVVILPSLLGDS